MKSIKTKIQESNYFIIAEVGLNHDGGLGNAIYLIEEAKNAGVDAIKFQLHIPNEEGIKKTPTIPFYKYEERYEFFERTAFSLKEWKKLRDYAHGLGLYFIVTPFSIKAVDILEEIDIDAYKIPSGETSSLPLLEHINSKNKSVLLSTGMSNWEEITNAVDVLKPNLIVIFQCSSQYPCPPESLGLNVIKEMITRFKGITIGYSDHTLNNYASIAALIYGAKVFEKHFTLSKKMYGPDASLSFEPHEMRNYVRGLDFISKALKNLVDKNNIKDYKKQKILFEKSIVAARDLIKGYIIEYKDLTYHMPGDGIRADKYKEVIGKKLVKNIKKYEKIHFEHLK